MGIDRKNDGSIERPFWQTEWLNINFESLGVPLFTDKLASSDFYSSFYSKLFSIYNDFESLPSDWLNNKIATAEAIGIEVSQNASVLSYGCGIGYVEKQLVRFRPDLTLTAFDFSETAGKWIKRDLHKITYTHTVQDDSKYDVIYLSQVLYALSFSESVDLLKSLSRHLKNNGKLFLINTSVIDEENGGQRVQKSMIQKLKIKIKDLKRPTNRILFPFIKGQFWGWERNNLRYIEMATLAELKLIKIFSKANQAFIILSK